MTLSVLEDSPISRKSFSCAGLTLLVTNLMASSFDSVLVVMSIGEFCAMERLNSEAIGNASSDQVIMGRFRFALRIITAMATPIQNPVVSPRRSQEVVEVGGCCACRASS